MLNKEQVVELIKSGKKVIFNSSYYAVGYDEKIDELVILAKHNNNHIHYLDKNDINQLKIGG